MLVSILTFVMVRTAGGDPASLKLGLHASPESLARLRREMGLTDPWPVQYGHWFADAVRGDLGRSYLTGSRVTYEILNRFPATLELALASLLISVPLGIAAGSVGRVVAAEPARGEPGRLAHGQPGPAHAEPAAGGPAPGLCPHGPRQGPPVPPPGVAARVPERPHPGRDGDRAGDRVPARRRG